MTPRAEAWSSDGKAPAWSPMSKIHGVAFFYVGCELLKERGGALAEMLLLANFKLLAAQDPRNFGAIGFQLATDGRNEQPKLARRRH
jgi:hypothetical protein